MTEQERHHEPVQRLGDRRVGDLGGLKGNKGEQQYAIPARAVVRGRMTVVIWCRAFSVLFARAPLRMLKRLAVQAGDRGEPFRSALPQS